LPHKYLAYHVVQTVGHASNTLCNGGCEFRIENFQKKGRNAALHLLFLEDTTGSFVVRKERSELVMTCSVMALIFAGAYSAVENGWKAFSLTQREKRGRDVTVDIWKGWWW